LFGLVWPKKRKKTHGRRLRTGGVTRNYRPCERWTTSILKRGPTRSIGSFFSNTAALTSGLEENIEKKEDAIGRGRNGRVGTLAEKPYTGWKEIKRGWLKGRVIFSFQASFSAKR